jgi:hypothetical protein
MVYDPITNTTCLLENYEKSPKNEVLQAKILDNTAIAFYRAKDDFYYLYVKGENIANRTKSAYVDNDLLVYDQQTNTTYILKDFKKNSDNQPRPAVLFDNAESAFWRSMENSYWLYVKGEDIQSRTKSARIENDLIVYDEQTNITYLFKDFADKSKQLKLNPAQVVSYQDQVFWRKKGNAYWLILKGEMISDRTTSRWEGEDLYVTDTKTNVTYIFPDYKNASENQLRPAPVNPGK